MKGPKYLQQYAPRGLIVSEDTPTPAEESPDSETPVVTPLEVKVTNKIERKWNDDVDDIEYDEITLSKEDMDI